MTRGWKARYAGVALLALTAFPAAAADGEQLFKAKCNTCHGAKKVMDGVRKVEADKRQAHFDQFLASHYAPDAAQREAILTYLLAAANAK